MRYMKIDQTQNGLRGPERRLIQMLRAWGEGEAAQTRIWTELTQTMGSARAAECLRGFEDMLGLLRKHAWHAPLIQHSGASGYSEDELAIARFVMAATEQRRDVALSEASFLVTPTALLPLMTSATRTGLPLLCEDCRARVMGYAQTH